MKDIKSYWQHDYPGKNLAFSSRVSTIVPGGNRPSHGTSCMEYSITELDSATGNPPVQTLWRVEGLTCAWLVDDPKPGKMTIEQFWLEAYDGYDPAKGQKPLESFELDRARSVCLRPALTQRSPLSPRGRGKGEGSGAGRRR